MALLGAELLLFPIAIMNSECRAANRTGIQKYYEISVVSGRRAAEAA
jgi:hypothetical protein